MKIYTLVSQLERLLAKMYKNNIIDKVYYYHLTERLAGFRHELDKAVDDGHSRA